MAKIQVMLNGSPLVKSEKTLEFMKSLMTTRNPDSVTIRSYVAQLPAGYDAAFAANYPSDSRFEVIEDGKVTAQNWTASQLLKKIEVVRTVDEWQGEIVTEKGKTSGDKGEIEI
jgi:hypothetical protein